MEKTSVHKILERLNEFGEISVHKVQGWRSILDLQAPGRHWIKNRLDSVLEMSAWIQESFRKSISVSTHLLWVKGHLNGLRQNVKLLCIPACISDGVGSLPIQTVFKTISEGFAYFSKTLLNHSVSHNSMALAVGESECWTFLHK